MPFGAWFRLVDYHFWPCIWGGFYTCLMMDLWLMGMVFLSCLRRLVVDDFPWMDAWYTCFFHMDASLGLFWHMDFMRDDHEKFTFVCLNFFEHTSHHILVLLLRAFI